MLKFEEQKFCTKCKEPRFYLNHIARFVCRYHKSPIEEELNTCTDEGLFHIEHMDVTCSRCGFTWIESPADYTEQPSE